MSVTTKTVWNKFGFSQIPSIGEAKDQWFKKAIEDGKTDDTYVVIDPITSIKVWADQTAADEWTTFITDLATKNGYTVTVTTI